MASAGRFIGGREAVIYWTQDATTTTIVADAMLSVGATAPAEISDYPIENGIDASDHIALRPQTLTLELMQTEHPLPSRDTEFEQEKITLNVRQSDFRPGGALALTQAVGTVINAGLELVGLKDPAAALEIWVWKRGSDSCRVADLHDLLLSVREDKALLKIDVAGRTYDSYALQDVAFSQSGPAERGVFTLQLRHVRLAPSTATDTALGLSLPSPAEIGLAAAREAAKAAAAGTQSDVQAIKEKGILLATGEGLARSLGF